MLFFDSDYSFIQNYFFVSNFVRVFSIFRIKEITLQVLSIDDYKPFHNLPDNFDDELKQSLIDAGEKSIYSKIFPAFARLEDFCSDVAVLHTPLFDENKIFPC